MPGSPCMLVWPESTAGWERKQLLLQVVLAAKISHLSQMHGTTHTLEEAQPSSAELRGSSTVRTHAHAGRMTRRERKQTLTEELLADAELAQSRRKRFGVLQAERQRWSSKKGRKTRQCAQEGLQTAPSLGLGKEQLTPCHMRSCVWISGYDLIWLGALEWNGPQLCQMACVKSSS